MVKKKLGCVLLIVLMASSLLAGCSPAEKGYYALVSSVNRLNTFYFSGSIKMDVDQLPADVFNGDGVNQAMITKAFDTHRIEYDGMVDKTKQSLHYNITLVENSTGLKTKMLSLVYQNGILYVQIQDLINYLKIYGGAAQAQQLDQTFAGVEWVSFNRQELNNLLAGDGQPINTTDLFAMSLSQQSAWQRMMDVLVNNAYSGYQTGLITQNSGQYTLSVKGTQIVNVLQSFTQYSIQNFDQIAVALKGYLQSLTSSEMSALGLTGQTRTEAIQAIDSMAAMVKYNRDQYLAEVNSDLTVNASELGMLNDSELISTISKTDAKTYFTSGKLHLHITGAKSTEHLEMTVNVQNTIKADPGLQIITPTAGLVSWTELNQRLPRQMNVNVDTGRYSLYNGFYSSQGNVNVQVINGRTYLPLRKVAESLGEQVGWDSAWYQPYVERNGQRIYMTGLLINDRAYIKMVDFEKLGYQITWSDYTHTVTISK